MNLELFLCTSWFSKQWPISFQPRCLQAEGPSPCSWPHRGACSGIITLEQTQAERHVETGHSLLSERSGKSSLNWCDASLIMSPEPWNPGRKSGCRWSRPPRKLPPPPPSLPLLPQLYSRLHLFLDLSGSCCSSAMKHLKQAEESKQGSGAAQARIWSQSPLLVSYGTVHFQGLSGPRCRYKWSRGGCEAEVTLGRHVNIGAGVQGLRKGLMTSTIWGKVCVAPTLPSLILNSLSGGLWSACDMRAAVVTSWQVCPGCRVMYFTRGDAFQSHGDILGARRNLISIWLMKNLRFKDFDKATQLGKVKSDLGPKAKGCWVQEKLLWLQWGREAFLVLLRTGRGEPRSGEDEERVTPKALLCLTHPFFLWRDNTDQRTWKNSYR